MKVSSIRVSLGSDPEIKFTQNGDQYCVVSVAEKFRKKRGDEWVDETSWHYLTVFGKQAEWFGELQKGDSIAFSGEYRTRQYEDKNGDRKTSHEIFVNEFSKLQKREKQ